MHTAEWREVSRSVHIRVCACGTDCSSAPSEPRWRRREKRVVGPWLLGRARSLLILFFFFLVGKAERSSRAVTFVREWHE
ncbi:hypothetical protein MTO96_040969 [Rhipicephalus appendiculatus]